MPRKANSETTVLENTAPEKKPRKKRTTKTRTTARRERKERLFALDIGTRSVIGIVAEKEAHGLKIIATERQEITSRPFSVGRKRCFSPFMATSVSVSAVRAHLPYCALRSVFSPPARCSST